MQQVIDDQHIIKDKMDDEMQMLMRQLMEVQQQRTNPLSQRTVAEIMVKLHREGFAFFPTTDGNQYVTPHQLDQEIITITKERGKIALTMLPQILNIGSDTVESRVNPVLQAGGLTRQGNNLFSPRYFQELIVTLSQRLTAEGRISLQEVAIENQLNPTFMQTLVEQNIDELHAQLNNGQLITKEYTLLRKAKLLGFMIAVNNPLTIDTLQKIIGGNAQEIQTILEGLITEGKIKGKLQGGYFVPQKFTDNQQRVISQFFQNNGYIELDMLKKKYLVANPEDWAKKHLPQEKVRIGQAFFTPEKIQSLSTQLNALLKTEGFVELTHILPFQLDQADLTNFLEDNCGLKDYFLCEGYCYSNDWLERLANQFKDKVLFEIFFKRPDGKKDKKKGKKEKVEVVNQNELKQVLFNCGFADYTGAQTLAPQLLPLLLERIEQLRKRMQKELVQSKGFLSSSFLKYKSCKTILRSEQSLNRAVNVIQKQQKKGEKWVDTQFGPNQNDKLGQYALVYYDKALPKGWPTLQTVKWVEFTPKDFLVPEAIQTHTNLRRGQIVSFLQLITFHNKQSKFSIPNPAINPLQEESNSPYVFRFHISEKEVRYVLVDSYMPLVEQKVLSSMGPYALAEKAYAKLRYCYKGIIGVGLQQLILEVTGLSAKRYSLQSNNEQIKMLQMLQKLGDEHFVMLVGEGEADKPLILGQIETELMGVRPYCLFKEEGHWLVYPFVKQKFQLKDLLQIFRNVFVVQIASKQ